MLSDHLPAAIPAKEYSVPMDVQLILHVDAKKQRKHVKQILLDRGTHFGYRIDRKLRFNDSFFAQAFEKSVEIRNSMTHGMPFFAIDVPRDVVDLMTRSSLWITDDDAWKTIVAAFLPGTTAYAQQIREAVAKRRAEGLRWIVLYVVKEDRVQILSLV